ncbi:hypothetical protein ACO0RG_000825 [Hanseniaspora osmophila]|uniref:Mediator of RNA polymerase II transcription subunit 20 n=1 Tax=Hanseniaspora osmophila TaxID=56408 RepID=A0A1E5R1M3_9ASCO|nr:hypothetical protein AWRI3579_g3950 [Hanseniaspora osmophila]
MKHVVHIDTRDANTIVQLSDALINHSYSRSLQQWSFDSKTFRAPSKTEQTGADTNLVTEKTQYFLHFLSFNNQQEVLVNYKSVTSTSNSTQEKCHQNGIKLCVPGNFTKLLQNGCLFQENLQFGNDLIFNKILNSNKKWQQRQSVSGKQGHIYTLNKSTVKTINVYTSSNELKGCIVQIDSEDKETVNNVLVILNLFVEECLPKNSTYSLLDKEHETTDSGSEFQTIRDYIKFLDL